MLREVAICGHVPGTQEATTTTAALDTSVDLTQFEEQIASVEPCGREFVWGKLVAPLGYVARSGCPSNINRDNWWSLISSLSSGPEAVSYLELTCASYIPSQTKVGVIEAGAIVGIGRFKEKDDHQIYVLTPHHVRQIGEINPILGHMFRSFDASPMLRETR